MKKLYIAPVLLILYALYGLFIGIKIALGVFTGASNEPLDLLWSGQAFIFSAGIIIAEYYICIKRKPNAALALSIVFGMIFALCTLNVFYSTLALTGVTSKVSETAYSLLTAIFNMFFYGIFSVVHYYIFKQLTEKP